MHLGNTVSVFTQHPLCPRPCLRAWSMAANKGNKHILGRKTGQCIEATVDLVRDTGRQCEQPRGIRSTRVEAEYQGERQTCRQRGIWAGGEGNEEKPGQAICLGNRPPDRRTF